MVIDVFPARAALQRDGRERPAAGALPRRAGRLHAAIRAGLVAAALATAGCSSLLIAPDPEPSGVAVPAEWSNATATQNAAAIADWWRRFNDPQLTALVTQALAANGDVRTAQAALRKARAQRDVAAAGLLPSVNAGASAQRTKAGGKDPVNSYQAGFDASWEPDVFGGTTAGVAAADADTRAAAASLAAIQVSIAAETAGAYVDLCTLQRRLAIARDNFASQEETLQIAQWRAQAGLTTSLDVEQARTSAEVTRAQIPALNASIAQATSRLAVLTATTPEAMTASLHPAAAVPHADGELALAFPADTLRQRPDVRRAEEQIRAAASRVTQADAARYPSFRLSGSLGLTAATFAGLSGGNSLLGVLLGAVSLPVYSGGALTAQVLVQEAALDQSRVAWETVVLGALKEVEDALVTLSTSRERLATLERAAEAARNASLLARFRYNSGLIDFQAVLQTQVSLLSVEDSVANAQASLALAHVQLYKALGGGWQPESATQAGEGARGDAAAPAADGVAGTAVPAATTTKERS